jgi:hypothetical protein
VSSGPPPPPADPQQRDPNSMPCSLCGHVWFEGERSHEHGADTEEDRRVLCALCRDQLRIG